MVRLPLLVFFHAYFHVVKIILFFNKFIYFIYLFLATSGLRCYSRALSSYGEQGPLFVTVGRPLTAVASPAAEHGL